MAPKPKLVSLVVEETSGVDHPAHLIEGWLVAKSAGEAAVAPPEADPAAQVGKEEDTMPETKPAEKSTVDTGGPERVAELEAELATKDARIEELEKAAAPATNPEDEVLKDVPDAVRALIAKEREDREAALSELRKEREDRARGEAIAKAREFEPLGVKADELGPQLLKVASVDKDLADNLTTMLKALTEQVRTSELFKSFGTNGDAGGGAVEELERLAKAAVEAGQVDTMPKAIAKVARDNPSLYARYRAEKGA